MDGFAMLGALAASEGTNAMAILAPTELPPGHVSWTTKDIGSADRAFATFEQPPPSLLQAWLVTGACIVAWKEATFDGVKTNEKDKDTENEEAR